MGETKEKGCPECGFVDAYAPGKLCEDHHTPNLLERVLALIPW